MTEGYTRELTLGYNHVFQDGRISMVALMEELEETASEHCRVIGQNIFSLLEKKTSWILKGGALKMEQYPGYSQTIRIETWISSLERYRGYREFLILDEDDKVLGCSSSLWIFMDLGKRTLIPIPDIFHEKWGINSNRPLEASFRKNEYSLLSRGREDTFDLRRRDFDSNQHVHNIRYLEWITESVPSEVYEAFQIRQLEMLYRKEARSGNPIRIRTEPLGENSFRHDIRDSKNGTLLASARSVWSEKKFLYSQSERAEKRTLA